MDRLRQYVRRASGSRWGKGTWLASAVLLLFVALLEVVARVMVVPSSASSGRLLGVELLPYRLHAPFYKAPTVSRSKVAGSLVVGGKSITYGDLWGKSRSHDVLGYVPSEGFRSVNGWWQNNSIGARSAKEFDASPPAGRVRLLIFGDSFAVGSRLPLSETWFHSIDERRSDLEVVNLGADGYSLAQSYLRFQLSAAGLQHDLVLLVSVPGANLWRDVNVRRDIGGGWDAFVVMPRYVLQEGELALVENPFAEDERNWEPALREHLALYDRFYRADRWSTDPSGRTSVLYRLVLTAFDRVWNMQARQRLAEFDQSSEAMLVSRAIINALRSDVESSGGEFLLAVFPTGKELDELVRNPEFLERWRRMVDFLCPPAAACVDVGEKLAAMPDLSIDRGYDGTHHGPKVNLLIAEIVERQLDEAAFTLLGK